MNTIEFDKPKFDKLKKAYAKAVSEKQESFMFENVELVTDYAKYVLEYLTPKFNYK